MKETNRAVGEKIMKRRLLYGGLLELSGISRMGKGQPLKEQGK